MLGMKLRNRNRYSISIILGGHWKLGFICTELWLSVNKFCICVESCILAIRLNSEGWKLEPWHLCQRQTPGACIRGGGTATSAPRIQNGFKKILQMWISK
ncbi:hypothetical protein L1987_82861 [Smallanthus sonchifolius]|uniref:Uncharacterized protein n=1 Tax=Smallanthus sonchifolius TaxID=185202 RepID=A0ACB8YBS2_9ASTR|nr:hypothetical protein L1987_82861 [Smallanthus sonchifolius]